MRVAVVGLGLIGGSIALAARERLATEVHGWDRDPAALAAALELGVISSGAGSLAGAVAAADVVFTAAPVGALPDLVREVLAHVPASAIVSDVGSTKRSVVEAISDPRFVGGHPLAGSEMSGVQHASPDLFEGSIWYLTPGAGTAAESVSPLEQLIAGLGATVRRADARDHDRWVAAVSHLPHVFANVLVAHALAFGAGDAPGPSFRDATRVAGANPALWSEIFMDNRDELIVAIDDAVARLEAFRDHLTRGHGGVVAQWCRDAADEHERLRR